MKIRTGYSFRNAVGKIDKVIARLQQIGWDFAPITDTASTFGYVRWKKACDKAGLKPVFGVELAVTRSIHAKKPAVDFWTFIAKDSLEPIHNLIAMATNQFRYQPLLTIEQALAAENVFKIVGHRSPFVEQSEDDPEAFSVRIPAGDPDLYVGLGPALTKGQYTIALELGHQFVATGDNRYTFPEDRAFYEIVVGRNASTQTYIQYIMGDDEWERLVGYPLAGSAGAGVALANRSHIVASSTAKPIAGHLLQPERPKPLRQMCEEGAAKLGVDLTDPVYKERMDRELRLIAEKDFEDYFYIIADLCQWSRERMIVGPARGSSCGSLVCYLLEITTVDPIPYGLIFERFIDISRNDLPDIDIDFSDTKRQMAFDYMAEKYGSDHVARLGTVALYKPRSALQEAAVALDVPPWHLAPVLDSILERSGGDARALQATEDTLNDTQTGRDFLKKYPEILVATEMEGHPRHYSQHAAGIILTDKPVSAYVAVDMQKGSTHCDKKDAEELNLLKIDALGLTQLSIFEDCLVAIGKKHTFLDTIPLNDQKAFDVLNKGHFSGIFQFNGLALQSVSSQIVVEDLEDIVSITALARPGPLNTGGTKHWIKVKTGAEPVSYPHPLFEPYLKSTLGVVAYQEQVMEIGRQIGGMSWEDVTALRKAMSKSLGAEFFNKYGDAFKKNAIAKGIPEDIVNKVWDDLCAYGSWAFNRSHAVAYGLVSYYCCWLKAHYPMEFAAATLTHTDNWETQIKILREMAAEGIGYIPADKELSTNKWTTGVVDGQKVLVGPLSMVKGIGPKLVSQVMSARKRGEPLPSRALKLLENPKTKIDSLFPVRDRIQEIMPDPREKNIFTLPLTLDQVQTTGVEQRDLLVFAVLAQIKPRDENEEMNVVKRNGRRIEDGKTAFLNLRLMDDTDVIFAKVNRWDFEQWGKLIMERGRPGKAIYAIKGHCPPDFRMIQVKMVRYIGDMDDSFEEKEAKVADFEEEEDEDDDNA